MKSIDVINDSALVLATKLSTKLRDTMMCEILVAFKGRPVLQKEMGALFGLSESYVSRALRHYADRTRTTRWYRYPAAGHYFRFAGGVLQGCAINRTGGMELAGGEPNAYAVEVFDGLDEIMRDLRAKQHDAVEDPPHDHRSGS